ncbi:MAG: hypothetical protein IJ324_11925 [Lachnospiraceae bacterium]|nr:hypothetical protein [Lachnospiraceae bacterium]
MSRVVRRQLFSVVEILKEAHENLGMLIEKDARDEIVNLLSECQDGAIMMGNQIEAIYGEGYECVHILERFCETVFHIAEKLEEPQTCMEHYCLVGKQLGELEKAMEQELPDKLEVVFFPYKASLWDSLESVYQAAVEDANCDAYCVPIPYYDLNKDKSFGAFHDESGEYPENVSVTSWQEYDFELRKPDVVIIHNPYDNWNTETSVEPRFYASNLRQYTEKLVYIPYFVLDDIKPDDEVAIENIKHYCFLPGVIHADKVIVQSENMRRIYINEYVKAAEDFGMEVDEVALDDKILGLGSPLSDKMQSMDIESVEIPEEWEKLIYKPNGERKKVVLYHTSINDVLYHRTKIFAKIKSVLDTFKENQENIVLWWKPHPLIDSMLKEQQSELWYGLMEIVEQYREEGWGIYDDHMEWEQVLIATDAYFGDWNTVVWKYQKLGKPTMLEDVNIL